MYLGLRRCSRTVHMQYSRVWLSMFEKDRQGKDEVLCTKQMYVCSEVHYKVQGRSIESL